MFSAIEGDNRAQVERDLQDCQDENLILVASEHNQLGVIKRLLEIRGDSLNFNAKDTDGNTALHCAIRGKKANEDLIKYLIDNEVPKDEKANSHETALLKACRISFHEGAKALLSNGCDVNIDADGWTPLMEVCRNSDDVELVKLMIETYNAEDERTNSRQRWAKGGMVECTPIMNFELNPLSLKI